MIWIIWIGAALVLGILELLTVDLFFLTLAFSALGAGISALFGVPVWLQLTFFVLFAAILLAFVRPWARGLLQRSTPDLTTNAQAYAGKTGVVTAPLVGANGRVKIGGEVWSATGEKGETFPVGSKVRVLRIDGATAVVGALFEQIPTSTNTSF